MDQMNFMQLHMESSFKGGIDDYVEGNKRELIELAKRIQSIGESL